MLSHTCYHDNTFLPQAKKELLGHALHSSAVVLYAGFAHQAVSMQGPSSKEGCSNAPYRMGSTEAKVLTEGHCLEGVQDGSNLDSEQSLAIIFLRITCLAAIYWFLSSF